MKKLYSFLAFASLTLASCSSTRLTPSQTFVTFEVAATDVREIEVGNDIKVVYTQSPETSVKVEAPDNFVDYVKVGVKNGVLTAYLDFGTLASVSMNSSNVSVYVSSPVLYDIDTGSSASVVIADGLKISSGLDIDTSSSSSVSISGFEGAGVTIDCSSSSVVSINGVVAKSVSVECSSSACVDISGISADYVSAEANSSASVSLSGVCTEVNFEASSSAGIDASALRASKGRAEASSSSGIRCSVDKLSQETSSSARIVNK